jgi:hypothetical protein
MTILSIPVTHSAQACTVNDSLTVCHPGLGFPPTYIMGETGVQPRRNPLLEGGSSDVVAVAISETPAQINVRAIRTRIVQLHARDAKVLKKIVLLQEQIEREQWERDEVAVEVAKTEAELEAAIQAPVVAEEDPTEWLADELMILILLQVEWGGQCNAVCRRWHGLCRDAVVKKRL